MTKKLTALFIALGIFFTAFAETFVVTSNADSGPGTLREAIGKANGNGTAIKDYIYFNISDQSISGRTITLLDTLPALTSHMVIDASSQPGFKFGVTDAKIKIISSGQNTPRCFIIMNVEGIEIYGLFILGFKTARDVRFNECAIYITGAAKDIKIGKPGAGNLFQDNGTDIYKGNEWIYGQQNIRVSDVVIKSNFFGLNEEGTAVSLHQRAITFNSVRNITIGGWNANEGNYFAGYGENLISLVSDSSQNNGQISFLNNKCGVTYDGTTPIKFGGLYIRNQTNAGGDEIVTIQNNVINNPNYVGSNSCYSMISISNIKGFITIKGNKIGELIDFVGCQVNSIGIGDCENGIIGGEAEEDRNVIAKSLYNGISLYNNRNITVSKNILYCNSYGIKAQSTKVQIPEIKILSENGTNVIGGTATPNCKIEVFETPYCEGCNNGRIFLGTTTSDDNGNWSFTGSYSSAVSATATTKDGVTGELAKPDFTEPVDFKHPTCGQNNGYIRGAKFISGTRYYWVRTTSTARDTIHNQLDLENAVPGWYEFVVEQTKYCKKTYQTYLGDRSPKINAQNIRITHPSCGKANGAIDNVYASGSYQKIIWKDKTGNTVANTLEAIKLLPGEYKLIVLDTTYHCGDSTGYFTLTNQSGPTLHTSSIRITHATCDFSNGSIKNISTSNVTGTPFIQWIDSTGKAVASSLDLTNVPAGKYRLKFKDRGTCDTIITPFYTIEGRGAITLDTSQLKTTPSHCIIAIGAINGVQIAGATNYVWTNSNGQTISQQANPGPLFPGTYILKVSNAYCEQSTRPITVPITTDYGGPALPRPSIKPGYCNQPDGYVRYLNYTNPQQYTFRWVDSASNQTISNELNLEHIIEGTFYLYTKDVKGCEQKSQLVRTWTTPLPELNESNAVVADDLCDGQLGKIENISLVPNTGARPFTYSWIDEQQHVAGSNPNLVNVKAGKYYLVVKDSRNCMDTSKVYTILNRTIAYTAPHYKDQTIPKNTAATLSVQNAQTGTYQLFEPPSLNPIQENTTGIFITDTLQEDKTYHVRIKTGSCESEFMTVHIKVADEAKVFVPTAFTPNKDGKNEILKPTVNGLLQLEYFTVYDRWGSVVFTTKDPAKGWNGFNRGIQAPTGVYVWVLTGKDIRGNVISLKGSSVLIR